jgi:hypothetical protein
LIAYYVRFNFYYSLKSKENMMFSFIGDVFDFVLDSAESVIDTVTENPVKSVVVAATTVATGGLALAYAPAIAAAAGSAGLLGAASTGTAISSLSGAALTNASLAALGGGSVASGGLGMAGGTAVVTATGGTIGAATSSIAIKDKA